MTSERESWNQRYNEGPHGPKEPDPFLLEAYREYVEPKFARPGTALDLAGGTGRHGLWLAERRWQVTMLDVSQVGIERAQQGARQCGLQVEFVVADLLEYDLGSARFDLVLGFFYLERELFAKIARALRPGGLVVYKTYTVDQLAFGRGPKHPMHLLKHNELLHAFPGFRVLHYRETLRERGVAELVASREEE